MLSRSGDAFSQLKQVEQRKYINAVLMLWVMKDMLIMSFAGVCDSADACRRARKTSLKRENGSLFCTFHNSVSFDSESASSLCLVYKMKCRRAACC